MQPSDTIALSRVNSQLPIIMAYVFWQRLQFNFYPNFSHGLFQHKIQHNYASIIDAMIERHAYVITIFTLPSQILAWHKYTKPKPVSISSNVNNSTARPNKLPASAYSHLTKLFTNSRKQRITTFHTFITRKLTPTGTLQHHWINEADVQYYMTSIQKHWLIGSVQSVWFKLLIFFQLQL